MNLSSLKWKYVVLAAIPALIVTLSLTQLLYDYELILYDFRLQLRPVQNMSEDIALIEIDDETLNRLGSWPLPRDYHASLVDVLHEAGVKSIIFDLVFSESGGEDPIFAASMKSAGNVFLPKVFNINAASRPAQLLESPSTVLAPITETLSNSITSSGHINILVDPDGKIRKTVLYVNDGTTSVPQFGLMAACHYLDLDCANIEFQEHQTIIDKKIHIPVSDFNEVMVNYPGRWKETFKHYSYFEILKAYQLWKELGGDPGVLSELKGKVCFIGTTAVGTIDLRATPLENNYPMIGLHASMLNSIINEKYIHRAPDELTLGINLILFALALFICVRFTPLISFVGSLILGGVYFLGTLASLLYYGFWLDAFLPLIIIFSTYVGCALMRWLQEIQMRQVLEKEMTVAADIQSQFLIGPDHQDIDHINIAKWFQPAKYVAGDLYDIFKIDEQKVGFFLGDVSGKGLPASLLMAQAISSFRIFSRQLIDPHDTLNRLNKVLYGQAAGRFVTAMYCVIDREAKTIKISSAGQGPAYIYRAHDASVEEISLPGKVPLGLKKDTEYETLSFSLNSEDCLVLFSDGATEARDSRGNEFGEEGVAKGIAESSGKTPDAILEYLKRCISEYSNQKLQHDDITVIVASFKD